MHTRIRRFVVIVAVGIAGMIVGRASKSAEPGPAGPADIAVRLAQEMAAAASRRDVKSLEKLIPQTERVAYVSNGHPITGRRYAETLGAYYDSLKTLDFKWDKWEVFPVGDRAAVFTGWATAKTVDRQGNANDGRALFTMVFADDGSGWKRVIAQKWQSQVPAVSGVHPASPVDRVPPASDIVVTFNAAVAATDSAFHLECPAGTAVAVTATPEPGTDGGSYVLHPATSLPAGAECRLKIVAAQTSEPRFGQTMAADKVFSFRVAAGS
jgi:SnoaL-like domain